MADLPKAEPIRPGERILSLDVLRGFAMFGVLIAYCLWNLGTAPPETYSRLDVNLDRIAGFVIDGKFYTILAFLFGLGFSIQLDRATDDATAVRTYARRLAALAAIGLAHALLLRNGDILLPYAVTGFLLIPLRRASNAMLFIVAGIALLFPYAAHIGWQESGFALPQRPELQAAPYLIENAAWVGYWLETAPFNWPTNLTLFVMGLYAGRRGLLPALAADRRKLIAVALIGLLAGGLLYWLQRQSLVEPLHPAFPGLLFTFHCWAMSSAYVAILLLALQLPGGATALGPLAAIGRLALTNYLLQAAIIVPLCLAFGWFDRFKPTSALALAMLLFFLVQIPFSLMWLRRFQFGPAEWIWRRLTYGRMPISRQSAADYAPV
ncbi:MAG: DUF418 domain-containing protein [Sphingomicrobium sp.]